MAPADTGEQRPGMTGDRVGRACRTKLMLTWMAGLLGAGCAGDGLSRPSSGESRPVDIRTMSHDGGGVSASAGGVRTPTPTQSMPARVGESTANEGILDVSAVGGSPRHTVHDPRPVSAEVLVDSTIGEINGKPIRASTFLPEVEARLRAIAREPEMTRERWRKLAAVPIGQRLNGMLQDELFRAEFLAQLQPEQKQGFFAWLENRQRNFVSLNRGSLAASQKTAEAEGKGSLEAWRQSTEEREAVRAWLTQNVFAKVHVSRRDIEQYYEAHAEEFNPPPTAQFRRVSVPKSKPQDAELVSSQLEARVPFLQVASSDVNRYEPEQGGLVERRLKDTPAKTTFFNTKALEEAAHTLAPGEWIGPLDVDGSLEWLFFDGVKSRTVPLYEAQLDIQSRLSEMQRKQIVERTVSELMARSKFTEIDTMGQKLLEIAEAWYLPPRTASTEKLGTGDKAGARTP